MTLQSTYDHEEEGGGEGKELRGTWPGTGTGTGTETGSSRGGSSSSSAVWGWGGSVSGGMGGGGAVGGLGGRNRQTNSAWLESVGLGEQREMT